MRSAAEDTPGTAHPGLGEVRDGMDRAQVRQDGVHHDPHYVGQRSIHHVDLSIDVGRTGVVRVQGFDGGLDQLVPGHGSVLDVAAVQLQHPVKVPDSALRGVQVTPGVCENLPVIEKMQFPFQVVECATDTAHLGNQVLRMTSADGGAGHGYWSRFRYWRMPHVRASANESPRIFAAAQASSHTAGSLTTARMNSTSHCALRRSPTTSPNLNQGSSGTRTLRAIAGVLESSATGADGIGLTSHVATAVIPKRVSQNSDLVVQVLRTCATVDPTDGTKPGQLLRASTGFRRNHTALRKVAQMIVAPSREIRTPAVTLDQVLSQIRRLGVRVSTYSMPASHVFDDCLVCDEYDRPAVATVYPRDEVSVDCCLACAVKVAEQAVEDSAGRSEYCSAEIAVVAPPSPSVVLVPAQRQHDLAALTVPCDTCAPARGSVAAFSIEFEVFHHGEPEGQRWAVCGTCLPSCIAAVTAQHQGFCPPVLTSLPVTTREQVAA